MTRHQFQYDYKCTFNQQFLLLVEPVATTSYITCLLCSTESHVVRRTSEVVSLLKATIPFMNVDESSYTYRTSKMLPTVRKMTYFVFHSDKLLPKHYDDRH